MYDVIVNHAIDNVWCAPLQDYEHTILPARLSPAGGWFRYGKVIWNDSLPLPNFNGVGTDRYHVYQIGKYPDFLLGVPNLSTEWVNLNKLMEITDCFVSTFIDNGITLSAANSYLRLLKPSNNIVLAVKIDHSYYLGKAWVENAITGITTLEDARLDYKPLYIRFYTNARLHTLYQRNKVNNPGDMVRGFSRYCSSVSDVNAFIAETNDPSRPIYGWMRVDGYVVSREWLSQNPFTAIGKWLYAYHDDTIIGSYWFKYSDLKSFRSKKNPTMDKYIMFYGRDLRESIFNNDVEYFLGVRRGEQFKGVYVPRFHTDAVTNLTHAIHALDTNIVSDLIENNLDFMDGAEDDLWIRAIVRQGGMVRGLTYEANRIEAMYQMSNQDIMGALQDLNSVMPEWQAANLEICPYIRLMTAPSMDKITPDLVMEAYGYNGMTKYMQPNMLRGRDISPPHVGTLFNVSNALTRPNNQDDLYMPLEIVEYNDKGDQLAVTRQLFPGGGEFYLTPTEGQLVRKTEVYVNNYRQERPFRLSASNELVIENIDLLRFGFGCYVCPIVNDVPNYKWIDVTTNPNYYVFDKGDRTRPPTLTWNKTLLTNSGLSNMTRINNESVVKEGILSDITQGARAYSVIEVPNQIDGTPTMLPGQLDIWVAGQHLYQDLDYFLDWPKIYISKQIIKRDSIYTARMSGLLDPTTNKNWQPTDFGFVKNGIVSVNGKFEYRHDLNQQINVGGQLYLEDEVHFAEDPTGGPLMLDGVPYAMLDYVTPIEFYTGHSTIIEKARAMEVTERVNAYLSLRVPTFQANNPIVAAGKRWNVVSIFVNELLVNLKEGWLDNELKLPWDNSNVAEWVEPFIHLLNVDITRSKFFDPEYVSVVPHTDEFAVEVTTEQFKFLEFVTDIYLNGLMDVENYFYVSIKTE